MKKIDIHTHLIPYAAASEYPRSVTPQELIAAMDEWGVGQAVVLPLESPECQTEYSLSAQVLELCQQHPDRLIPFVGVDPRADKALDKTRHYHARGAKGFGEHKCGLAMDDPRSMRVYQLCGELGLPVLFHMDYELNYDEAGLPRLARALREAKDTVFIGHGPHWWSAISAEDPRSPGHPSGPDFTAGFLERHWRKLLFGTDYFIAGDEIPQPEWLATQAMPEEWREAIGGGNARRLLGLE